MRGFNVLHPMGWDAFGLPAEQYAIQTGVHPAITTKKAIDNFRRQLKRFGFSYDWSREFGTIDPDYYKWTQWIFLQIYDAWFDVEAAARAAHRRAGRRASRAARARSRFNPDAAEISGDEKERDVRRLERRLDKRSAARHHRQLPARLPRAADRQLVPQARHRAGQRRGHRRPQRARRLSRVSASRSSSGCSASPPTASGCSRASRGSTGPSPRAPSRPGWIGHSEGAEVTFARWPAPVGTQERLRVFTTRPDTLFGATYMVVAPEHPLVDAVLRQPAPRTPDVQQLRAYVSAARNRSDLERQQSKEKTGVFTGVYAINPATGAAHPGLDRGLRADGLRHRRHHGRAGARRARPRVRHAVRPARSSRWCVPDGDKSEGCFSGDGKNINSHNAELSLDGLPTAEAKQTHHRLARAEGPRQAQAQHQAARLAVQPSALLGRALPDRLRRARQPPPGAAPSALPVLLPELADYQPEESDDPQAAARQGARLGAHHGRRRRRRRACRPTPRSRARPTPCPAGPARAGTSCATPTRRTPTR